MSSLLVLAACLLAGLGLRGRLDPAPLTLYVLHVALPALALVEVHRATTFSAWGVASVWLVFLVASLVFPLVGRLCGWDRATVGCLILTAGLSNTSFVGFPLLEVLVGPEALPVAVPLDQLGSFLLVCTLAPIVGSRFAGQSFSPGGLVRRMVSFPALWAVVIALLLRDVAWPAPVEGALGRIAATLSPVALVAVGAQLRWPPPTAARPMAVGLLYKLALAPLLVWAWMRAGGETGLGARVAVLEGAMAPMVTGAVLAQTYGLRPDLAGALLGVGVPLSFLTVWVWSALTI
ncbi:MAG: AEC family transporter [Pseudomonadota bacterium]|nr:AEC family transporter [Pseudomonadota bacterium]